VQSIAAQGPLPTTNGTAKAIWQLIASGSAFQEIAEPLYPIAFS